MVILSDIKNRCAIVADGSLPWERRIFALMETIFMPVSFLTLAALVVVPLLGWFGLPVTGHHGPLTTIFVSAAIGYITNWIAIEMLFKPYHRTMRHPFSWITCGYWRQGLVPKNKGDIAVVLGEQVATKLLQPKKIADDLCSMVGGVLRNPSVVTSIRDGVQRAIAAHDKEIAAALAPKIEAALASEIDRLLTTEKVEQFWSDHIEPRLRSAKTRDEIANLVIAALEKRAPALAAQAKPVIVSAIEDCVREKLPRAVSCIPGLVECLSSSAGIIADSIITRNTIEQGLCHWLHAPDTVPALRDELLHFVKAVREYLASGESREKVRAFVDEMRSTFKEYVRNYIETNLAAVSGRIINSESLWDSVIKMIPRFQPEIERLIRTEGMPLVMERLDIQGRIKSAVDVMDVAEFHGMINEVAAQHLGAIQVLGYLLGAAAGALTLLMG